MLLAAFLLVAAVILVEVVIYGRAALRPYGDLFASFVAVFLAVSLAFWQERVQRAEERSEAFQIRTAGVLNYLGSLDAIHARHFTEHAATLINETPLVAMAREAGIPLLDQALLDPEFNNRMTPDQLRSLQQEYFFAKWSGERVRDALAAPDSDERARAVVGYTDAYFRYAQATRALLCGFFGPAWRNDAGEIAPALAAALERCATDGG